MESRKIGEYASYFQDNHVVHMGGNYGGRLCGFDPWAKKIMSLIRFKYIRSTFHLEAGQSDLTGDT